MSYSVKSTPHFDNEVKRIAKKHKSIKSDLQKLINDLKLNPKTGINLGQNIYKIRMAISGSGKGKSGGARVITYVFVISETIYLSEIYLKSDTDSIDATEVMQRLKDFGLI